MLESLREHAVVRRTADWLPLNKNNLGERVRILETEYKTVSSPSVCLLPVSLFTDIDSSARWNVVVPSSKSV